MALDVDKRPKNHVNDDTTEPKTNFTNIWKICTNEYGNFCTGDWPFNR